MESNALEEKINRIRLKNEEIRRRYEEVEADKKHAAKLNALVKLVPSGDWPERREPPEFEDPPPMNPVKFKATSNERPQHPFQGNESKKSHKFAEGDGPPPDPKYNFLADSERELFYTNDNDDGGDRGDDRGAFNAPRNRRAGLRRRGGGGRGGPRDTYYSDNNKVIFPGPNVKDRSQLQYDVWRSERNKVDDARVSRQKTVQGNWRREWDANKVYSDKEGPGKSNYEKRNYEGDYSNRGNSGRNYQSPKSSNQDYSTKRYYDQQRFDNDPAFYNNGSKGPVMSVKVNSTNIAGTGRVGPRQKSRMTYSSQADSESDERAPRQNYGDRKFHRTRYSNNRRRENPDNMAESSHRENRSAPPKYSKSSRNSQRQPEFVQQQALLLDAKEEEMMEPATAGHYEPPPEETGQYYEEGEYYEESHENYENQISYDENAAAVEYYDELNNDGPCEDALTKERMDFEVNCEFTKENINQDIIEAEHESNEGSYKDVETNIKSCESVEETENTDSCIVEESQDSDYLDAMSTEHSTQNTPIHKITESVETMRIEELERDVQTLIIEQPVALVESYDSHQIEGRDFQEVVDNDEHEFKDVQELVETEESYKLEEMNPQKLQKNVENYDNDFKNIEEPIHEIVETVENDDQDFKDVEESINEPAEIVKHDVVYKVVETFVENNDQEFKDVEESIPEPVETIKTDNNIQESIQNTTLENDDQEFKDFEELIQKPAEITKGDDVQKSIHKLAETDVENNDHEFEDVEESVQEPLKITGQEMTPEPAESCVENYDQEETIESTKQIAEIEDLPENPNESEAKIEQATKDAKDQKALGEDSIKKSHLNILKDTNNDSGFIDESISESKTKEETLTNCDSATESNTESCLNPKPKDDNSTTDDDIDPNSSRDKS